MVQSEAAKETLSSEKVVRDTLHTVLELQLRFAALHVVRTTGGAVPGSSGSFRDLGLAIFLFPRETWHSRLGMY